jgi:pseudouridine kinase
MDLSGREGPVLVVGAAGVDIVGHALAKLVPETSNPSAIRISHGGVARNVAENLAHLGTETLLVTAVGDDPQGRQILARAEAEGVDVSASFADDDHQTGAYLAIVDRNGKLEFGLDDMRSISCVTPGKLEQRSGLFERASFLVLDANLPPDSLAAAIRLATDNEVPIGVDPTSSALAHRLIPHLEAITILSPNAHEASQLAELTIDPRDESSAISAARHFVGIGIGLAIVTMAEFGVVYATDQGSGHIPAVQTVIADPTGAGDALLATVIFALMNGVPVDEAVRLGVTAASLTLRTQDSVVPDLSIEMLYDQLI